MIKYVIGFAVACALWLFVLYNTDMPEYRVYDCGMAEWHPDVPPAVKEECRQLRKDQKFKNETTT